MTEKEFRIQLALGTLTIKDAEAVANAPNTSLEVLKILVNLPPPIYTGYNASLSFAIALWEAGKRIEEIMKDWEKKACPLWFEDEYKKMDLK